MTNLVRQKLFFYLVLPIIEFGVRRGTVVDGATVVAAVAVVVGPVDTVVVKVGGTVGALTFLFLEMLMTTFF